MSKGYQGNSINVSHIKDETVKKNITREAELREELNGMRDSTRQLQDEKDKAIRAFQPKLEKFSAGTEEEFEKLMKEKNACHNHMDKLKVKQHERQVILDDFRALALEIEPMRREIMDLEKKQKEVAASCVELKQKHTEALKSLKYSTQSDADDEIAKVEREITNATEKGNEKLLKVLTKQKNAAEKAKKEVVASYNLEERLLAAKRKSENLATDIEHKKAAKDAKENKRTDLKNLLDKDKPPAKHRDPSGTKSPTEENDKKKDEFKVQLDKVKAINAKIDANRLKKKETKPKNTELDAINKKISDAKDKRQAIMTELDSLKDTIPTKKITFKSELKFDLMGKGNATINQLQEDYGVSIRMESGGASAVVIVGGEDSIEECAEAVAAILAEAEDNKQKNEIDFDMKMAPQFIGSGGSNIQRLQKASGAEIKMDKEHGKILIQGSSESIETAKALVLQFIDENCSAELRFDAALRDVIIGKGGSVIREQEKESGCRRINVDRERSMIVMQGTKASVAKAVAAYTEIIEGMTSNAFTMRCDDRMTGLVIGPGGKTINDIQSTTKAFVECRNGTVTIRGGKDAVAAARAMIEDITQRDEVKVPFERYHYSMLTDRPWYDEGEDDEGNKIQGEEGESPLDEIWRVCEVDHMVALRSEGKVAIRGKKQACNQAKSMVEELLRNNRPEVARIAYPDILFQQFVKRGNDRKNMLDRIRERIPALVHCDVEKLAKIVEVAGPTDAVAEASAEIKAFVDKFNGNSKTVNVPTKAVRFVIGSGGSVIQDLQKKHKVTLNLDKDTNVLTIWSVEGVQEDIESCSAAVDEILKSAK